MSTEYFVEYLHIWWGIKQYTNDLNSLTNMSTDED